MLFVDDDQPEIVEVDSFGDQGVGADHDAGLTAGDVGQRLPPLIAISTTLMSDPARLPRAHRAWFLAPACEPFRSHRQ